MRRLGSDLRAFALLGVVALVGAAVGFSTTGHAKGIVSKFSRMVGVQSGTSTQRGSVESGTSTADGAANLSRGSRNAGLSPQHEAAAHAGPPPIESRLIKAHSFNGDLRDLPYVKPVYKERPEREPPDTIRVLYGSRNEEPAEGSAQASTSAVEGAAPAPAPIQNFDGLDFATWGAGHPPDPNGDVGPNHYIQTVNTSIGVYNKTGTRLAAFTFDTFMSQGQFGNVCDTDNFGDPVVLYDTFEDRWFITDFAFQLDAQGNISPQHVFQCFAASMSGDPVGGGWNFYSFEVAGGIDDYPKFGVWPDGIYMSANMFGYAATSSFLNPRVWALNKFQMYAGAPTVQVVSFDAPSADFTILPSNARLQTGTPPPGTPNYFISTWEFLDALTVYKFHVDWNSISLSTFTGPDIPLTGSSWPNQSVPNAATPGNSLDVIQIRAMAQNQYTNISAVESLWTTHTVRRATNGFAASRWYQVPVTGGSVGASTTQTATWDPDGANVTYRYVPSLAVDRMGDLALGYTTSNSTTNPGIKYAGRLATDPACTFWYTNEYYAVDGLNDLTRIGSFTYPSCTPVGSGGTVQGTVTDAGNSNPLSGAAVAFGSRTTTANGSGFYQFLNIPAGTYPSITAGYPGYNSGTATNIAVSDGNTTTRNFSLTAAAASACLTDTTQADFQTGVPTNTDLTTSAGNVILLNAANIDQHADDNGFGSGYGFSSTSLLGQTFTAGVSGQLAKVDAFIFCFGCSGTNPDMTLEVRTTSGGQPVMTAGGLLASSTIPGTSSGSGGFFTFPYSTPPTLTAATQYGIVIRLVSDRTTGTQAWLSSSGDVMAGGRRVTCSTSACSDPVGQNSNSDLIFKSYMRSGFAASGDFVSSVKDANPAAGFAPTWTTLSWTSAALPSGTVLKFQAAAGNNVNGPFNFVGPDGTASTFYT